MIQPNILIEKPKNTLDFLQTQMSDDVYTRFNNKDQLENQIESRINQICKQFIYESLNPYEHIEKVCGELGLYLDKYFVFLITASSVYSQDDTTPKEERIQRYVLGYDIKRIDYLMYGDKFEFHIKLNIDTIFGRIYIEYPHELTLEDYTNQLEPCIKRASERTVKRLLKEYYDGRK